jgi:preprotein translocase subunit YajC
LAAKERPAFDASETFKTRKPSKRQISGTLAPAAIRARPLLNCEKLEVFMGFGSVDLLFLLGMIVIMYFLFFLPQKRKQQAMTKMLSALKKGDRVMTQGGMYGEISSIKDSIVTLRFHDNVRIDFDKSAISQAFSEKEHKVEAKA